MLFVIIVFYSGWFADVGKMVQNAAGGRFCHKGYRHSTAVPLA